MSPRILLPLLVLAPALVSCAGPAGVDAGAVQAHKERMVAAQDIKFGILETLSTGSTGGVPESVDELLPLLQAEVEYWDRTGLADIGALARENVERVRAVRAPAVAGQADAAWDAWERVEHSCSGCHDRHPEQRVQVRPAHSGHGA